jgi:hypothetical protein
MSQPSAPNPSQGQGPQQLTNPSRQSATGDRPTQPLRQLSLSQQPSSVQAQSVGRIPGVLLPEEKHLAAKEELKNRLAHVVKAQATKVNETDPNITGVGVGLKFVEGQPYPELVVKVLVVKKFPRSKVPNEAMIPESVNGVATDVHEVGRIFTQARGRIPRPVKCGCEIGPAGAGESGTLGCLVVANGQLFILSNNHVLANVNQLGQGTDIIQPGDVSNGQDPADLVGVLDGGYPRIDPTPGADNRVDAALALTSFADNFDLVDPRFVDGTVMSEQPAQPAVGMNVHKCGFRTDTTFGQIAAAHLDNVMVSNDLFTANFNNMVMVTPLGRLFSAAGDSGSIILTVGTNQPVALLVGGSPAATFGCNIQDVASALGITRFVGTKP